jgi:putative lipoprotein
MKKALIMMGVLLTSVTITACSQVSKPAHVVANKMQNVVTGNALYLQRMALPSDAVITVTLSDTSKMDAPSETISQQNFSAKEQSTPFSFSLPYSKKQILPNHRYTVSAKVTVKGKLWFINDTSYVVLTDPAHTTHLDVIMKPITRN